MFGDEDVVLVLGRKLAAGVELHPQRRHMRAEVQHRRRELRALVTHCEFRIFHVALMAMRISKMLAKPRDHIELVARHVVADPIAGVFSEPVFAGARIDVAADAVADAEGHDLGIAGLGIDAADLRQRGRRDADVEGRAERHVEPAILVRREILPAMRDIRRHVVIDHLAVAELIEIGLGIVIFDQPVDIDDVERAVLERDAGRHLQALDHGLDLPLAPALGDRIDVAEIERTDEQRTLVAPGHLPRGQHAGGIDLDLEAIRQLDLLHRRRQFGIGDAGRRAGRRRQTFLGLGLVAEKPVRRRVGPELLGIGLVALEFFLSAGLTDPGECKDGGTCEHGSTEHRCHRVTPWAARFGCNVSLDADALPAVFPGQAAQCYHKKRERQA